MKIYRLEIWCSTSDESGWSYKALSHFYNDPTQLEKIKDELIAEYNRLEAKYSDDNFVLNLFDEWHKFLSGKLIDEDTIYDTHANMPEVNEYELILA